MIANRELYIKVIDNGSCGANYYEIDENVTVLMKDNSIITGTIKQIEEEYVIILNNNKNLINIKYKDMHKIANTDWLGGEDIRND